MYTYTHISYSKQRIKTICPKALSPYIWAEKASAQGPTFRGSASDPLLDGFFPRLVKSQWGKMFLPGALIYFLLDHTLDT